MLSRGAPGVCTAARSPQKPPVTEKFPPLIAPASAWPIVPLTENTPPVLVPPPPSIVNQSRAGWAWEVRAGPAARAANNRVRKPRFIERSPAIVRKVSFINAFGDYG